LLCICEAANFGSQHLPPHLRSREGRDQKDDHGDDEQFDHDFLLWVPEGHPDATLCHGWGWVKGFDEGAKIFPVSRLLAVLLR
jgi:hypothetical protein